MRMRSVASVAVIWFTLVVRVPLAAAATAGELPFLGIWTNLVSDGCITVNVAHVFQSNGVVIVGTMNNATNSPTDLPYRIQGTDSYEVVKNTIIVYGQSGFFSSWRDREASIARTTNRLIYGDDRDCLILLEKTSRDQALFIYRLETPMDKLSLEDLKKIAGDVTRRPEKRFEAILRIGAEGSTNAMDYLLQNICLHLPPVDAWDVAKDDPCMYALRKHKEQVMPHVFRFLGASRQEKEIWRICLLVSDVPGNRKMLLDEQKRVKNAPSARTLYENIDRVLQSLSHPYE